MGVSCDVVRSIQLPPLGVVRFFYFRAREALSTLPGFFRQAKPSLLGDRQEIRGYIPDGVLRAWHPVIWATDLVLRESPLGVLFAALDAAYGGGLGLEGFCPQEFLSVFG